MKNTTRGLLALVMVIFVVSACNKFGELGSGSSSKNGKLNATTFKPLIYQPDSLLLVGAKATDSIRWTVTPAGYDSLVTNKNTAIIFFKKAGSYQVQVTDNGVKAATASFTVPDSVYHVTVPQIGYFPLTGDQITLVPSYHGSPDSSYVSFVAHTKNQYCLNGTLMYTDSLKNNTYGINFSNVAELSPCTIGTAPVSATINFTQTQPSLLANGTYPVSVSLNKVTYTGSMVVTTTGIAFNWNYSSGVLISPLQISK
jgi:hypothetical protein